MQDLAVRGEGTFLLRYRVFDIWSAAAGPDQHPILAECYGRPFRVYSTWDFPGYQASTALTKVGFIFFDITSSNYLLVLQSVSRYGARVTMRDPVKRKGPTNYQSSEEDVSQGFDVGEIGSSKPLSYFSGIFPYHSGLDEHDSSA